MTSIVKQNYSSK